MDESNINESINHLDLLRKMYYENQKSPLFSWANYLIRNKENIEGAIESDVLENFSIKSNDIDITSLVMKSFENIQKLAPTSNEMSFLKDLFYKAGGKSFPFIDLILNYLCDINSLKIIQSRWNIFFSQIIDKDYDMVIKFVVEQMSYDKNSIENKNAINILSKNLTQKQINKLKDNLNKLGASFPISEFENILIKIFNKSFYLKCKIYSYFIYIACGIRPSSSKIEREILCLLINEQINFTVLIKRNILKNI